jgi:putative transposase
MLWRSLKYEEVYLHAYGNVAEAKAGIGAWLRFYNPASSHPSLYVDEKKTYIDREQTRHRFPSPCSREAEA